jgi:hypothetical protein
VEGLEVDDFDFDSFSEETVVTNEAVEGAVEFTCDEGSSVTLLTLVSSYLQDKGCLVLF